MSVLLSRLSSKLKKHEPATRKINVVLLRGEGLGLRYEWKAGSAGPEVMDVAEGHAAKRSGLRAGDVIYAINGMRTANGACMVSSIERMKERGGCFEIEVMRPAPGSPAHAVAKQTAQRARRHTQPPRGNAADYMAAFDQEQGHFPRSLTKPLLKAAGAGMRDAEGSIVPKMFEVVCPTQPDVEGTFYLLEERMNGAAMWGGSTGRRLYCTKSGLWALVDCVEGPGANIALVSSRFPSKGRMPHAVHWADWQSWDGQAWVPAPVRIEELRVDTVDGRPYWRGAFIEYYGAEKGQARWCAAAETSNVFATFEDLPDAGSRPGSPASLPSYTDSTYEPPSLSSVMFGENESIISTATFSVHDASVLSVPSFSHTPDPVAPRAADEVAA
eukprot:TRINITY_DN3027_c0_g1_i1.p1 TRINITY_DN3027_c0_g1~~TRINITY_DN3027_c0_g1_i1.p1  ORF type:complete len:386 (+),score=126.06 TRINITY_DN3027_c0_g1_i1:88-1245(+)